MAEEKTIKKYDRVRGDLEGVAVFTKPSTVMNVQVMTGKAETFTVVTARHHELGDYIFVECVDEDGVTRVALPPKVSRAILRQRDSLTAMIRSRHGKEVAKKRKERGEPWPFLKKAEQEVGA